MSGFFDRLSREPVLLGAALLAWVAVLGPSQPVMAAAVATVALLQRGFSTSQKSADELVEQARYVGELEKPPTS